MKRVLFTLCIAIPVFADGPKSVRDLAWMSGCWAADGAEAGSEEHWLSPAGGTLLGISRTVKNGKTVTHEFMQIREKDGGIVFIASPANQQTTEFRMVSLEGTKIVFENPDHDFPQRVIYQLLDGNLIGRIEGKRNGKERAFDFPMTRAKCE